MAPRTDTLSRLEALGPDAFNVALLYGVAYPLAPAQHRVAQWLGRVPFRGSGPARAPNPRLIVAQLLNEGFLEPPEQGEGYRAAPHHSAVLIRHAHTHGLLAKVLDELCRDSYVRDWSRTRATAAMLLRCAALTGEWQWLRLARVPIDWGVLLDPDLVGAIPRMPEALQHDAVYACTVRLMHRLQPADAFVAACEAIEAPDASVVANAALVRLAQGDLAGLERWLQRLKRPDHVALSSVRAAIHTLRGEDAAAMAALRAALEFERGDSRKRVLFPPYSAFSLGMLSLLRLNTRESQALFDELLQNAQKLRIENLALGLIDSASKLRSAPKPKMVAGARPHTDLDSLFVGLVLGWCESTLLKENRAFLEGLRKLAERAEATGFRWIAAEVAEVLAVGGLLPADPDRHRRLGTVTLGSALPHVEVWEHGLNALETLAEQLRTRKGKPTPARAVTRRLAWVVEDVGFGEQEVEAREQTLQKKGWGKGKPVSLRKLKEEADTLDWLTDQDRTVAGAITATGYRWGANREHHLPARGLFLLAGHPAVLDSAMRPLEVVAAEPELVVNDKGTDAICAELTPYPDGDAEYQVQYEEGDSRLTVLHLNESVRRLCQIIPPEGLTLPGSARARLLEVVSDLASEVRVHGGLSGTTANARAVEADSAPWVQLTPAGSGLFVRVLVQPVPESGMQFDPGAGGELVLAHVNDEALQTRRDLEAERRAATELANRCPALATAGLNQWRCEVPEAEDCLELLDQLQQAGARCLWPEGEKFRIVGHPGSSAMRLVIKSGREWFGASGELRIDEDRTLGLMQLMALLDERPRSRFVPLGDGQFVALGEGFRQQLGLLKGLTHGTGKSLRLHPLAAPALDELLTDIELEADTAWRDQVERMREARAFTPVVPGTLQAELRPYQHDGIVWLARLAHWGVGACLADDMGLGKTLQTLGLLLIRAPQGPALVVVPTSLVDNWLTEARRFAPTLAMHVYAGSAVERARLLEELGPFDVLVTTYGLLQNDVGLFAERRFHTAVLDEAQAIRNAATKRAQAARALDADFRMVITGTPVQNNLMDLHSLMSFLNPGLLGSAAQFRETHALAIERDQDSAARARLTRLIAPFVLRRTKTEVLDDLPSRTEIVRTVTLGPEEADFYEALRRQALADLEGTSASNEGARQLQVLAHLTRLRLACCHPQLVQNTGIRESAKLGEFMTLLDELLQNRHKVLVFSQFVKHLKLIEAKLADAGIRYQYLDGQTPRTERAERVRAFQSGDGDVFLISLKAGGAGLNLTAADYVIHMDPWWNPAAEDQASDRAHRIGQTRPVTIYRLVAKGTIEEQIVALHHRKRELAEQLLQDTDQVGRLDVDEMLNLLREPVG